MRWDVTETAPAGWSGHMRACGGTYFHSPAVVEADRDRSDAWFALLRSGGDVAGISVACPRGCRLSLRRRHATLPSLPAVREPPVGDYPDLLASLASRLADRGISALEIGSYGAGERSSLPADGSRGWAAGRERLEYRLPLDGPDGARLPTMSSHHRRYVRQGENAGFELRILEGRDALGALERVLTEAAARSREGGDGFRPPSLPSPEVFRPPSPGRWGGSVFAAFDGSDLLSAAFLGWGGGKAFYVSGGSTSAGYNAKAAFWMHPAIARDLAGRGFRRYNLGGTPADAEDDEHPQHGLYRFKSGFGADRIRCRDGTCRLDRAHLALHGLARRLSSVISPKSDE